VQFASILWRSKKELALKKKICDCFQNKQQQKEELSALNEMKDFNN